MYIKLKVKPNAKKNSIQVLEDGSFYVSLNAPPVDGKANAKLIEVLSNFLNIPKSKIFIKAGKHSKEKLVEIYD